MRNHSPVLILTLALSAFLISSCASSGSNKRVSKAERRERADLLFASFDANGDGFLTKEELRGGLRMAGMPELDPNIMIGMKKDKKKETPKASRKLTEEEIQKTMREAFERRDQDLDHRLNQDEFRKLVVERPPTEGDDPWAPLM
jgi:Ca2+-binding EF-hand superfamily protein